MEEVSQRSSIIDVWLGCKYVSADLKTCETHMNFINVCFQGNKLWKEADILRIFHQFSTCLDIYDFPVKNLNRNVKTNSHRMRSVKKAAGYQVKTQVFSCEYCEIFKNVYLVKHLATAAWTSCSNSNYSPNFPEKNKSRKKREKTLKLLKLWNSWNSACRIAVRRQT